MNGSREVRGEYVRDLAHAVPFYVVAPGALLVKVGGAFTGWVKYGIRLSPQGNGTWRTFLTLGPGEYHYWLPTSRLILR